MKSVVINASGGGTDTGSQANGLVEKNVTLEISNIIKNILESKGVDVYMLRDSDKTISYDERIKDLKNKYPNPKNVIVLSNTLNSGGSSGIDIVYALNDKDTLASKIANNIDYFNDTRYYQLRYPSDTTKDFYYITRNTPGYETIIVRYGYVDNAGDANIIRDNMEELATSVAEAIIDYIGADLGDYYIVKKGDTLYGIAGMYNTSVDEIKKLNNLSSNSLAIGQQLKIPEVVDYKETSEELDYYIVKKGDTLYGIASKYNTTVDNLKDINNLTSNLLSIGQKLKVSNDIEKDNIYVVKKGDTLYGIASMYNTTVSELKKLNNLSSNSLAIGQELKVNGNTASTYTVKSGDTLYSIASKYNTTVNKLKEINNLTSNLLSIGQVLYLP